MRFLGIALALALALVWVGAAYAEEACDEADRFTGVWWTAGNDARVEVKKVEKKVKDEDTGEEKTVVKYEGKMIWLKDATYGPDEIDPGKPRRDTKNPDPEKRDRTMVGMPMLENFEFIGDNVWGNGTIYDPESGKTYKCQATYVPPEKPADPDAPMPPAKLNVRGYLGVPAFGRTTVWTRYTPPKEEDKEAAEAAK